ncbi:uncharacterized protein LOC131430355 [Malaya genurostris]|uniref:uncharacterized protein LOC131430355 n=1 Tax=Malaya genurostris TaxID=325434 RepID=UPI0026F3BD8E|nr:uncharacterized protein LOC131430355 [Malaya genurostris]XP_058451242.1 uncharacterized protein LOC131430355 [Malaya genurostris]XP_058451243.1 uncharacterized protein LOC131430355 [Malaya genurostris]
MATSMINEMENADSSCAVCGRPDWAEKMVQCDRCDCWYHFTCAGVTDSIENRDWTSTACLPLDVSNGPESAYSRRSSNAAFELQKLKEEHEITRKRFLQEKALEKKRIAEEEAADRKKLEEEEIMERTFLKERYELRKSLFDAKSASGSVVSRKSSGRKSVEKVNRWLKTGGEAALNSTAEAENKEVSKPNASNETESPNNTTASSQNDNPASVYQQSEPTYSSSLPRPPSPFEYDPSKASVQYKSHRRGARIKNVLPPLPLEYDPSEASKQYESRYRDARSKNVSPPVLQKSSRRNNVSNLSGFKDVTHTGLSPAQIAARRVMTNGLPEFSGNPEDWPVFISQFNITTECCGFTNAENLIRLQQCLKGMARDSVRSRLLLPSSVPQVIETLKMLYGRPALLINSIIQRVRNAPAPKMEKLQTIIEFGMELQSLCDHIIAAEQEAQLTNPSLLQELEDKLPTHLKLQWAVHKQSLETVTLKSFTDFMSHLVLAASQITSLSDRKVERNRVERDHKTKQQNSNFLNTHSEVEDQIPENTQHETFDRKCLICGEVNHRVKDCEHFARMTVDERWRKVGSLKICRTCLNQHGRRRCRITIQCGIDGCQYKHNRLLHNKVEDTVASDSLNHRDQTPKAFFRIMPVTVCGKKGSIDTFAFLDDGSSLTLVEQSLAEQLGESGPQGELVLKWTGNVTRREPASHEIGFVISGQAKEQYQVNRARTVTELNLPIQSLDIHELSKAYPHLRGLPIQNYENAQPRILLGLDQLKLSLPLKHREGREGDPVAAKTRLGWWVFGGKGEKVLTGVSCHILEVAEKSLHDMVKMYFGQEDAGIKSLMALESNEEKRARQILKSSTKRIQGQYETGLLWRFDYFELPESYHMALHRLECLERRMEKNPHLKENIHRQISEYQTKGYAHRANQDEIADADPRRVWYLPLGTVTNIRKPGKVRLIWDAAASVDGISLNSMLLKGPDQLCSLPGALFRFRQRPVAISGDIREMFHQIRIRAEDRNAQRFLWRHNPKCDPEVYIMDVATFGSTCSPCSAHYIKNKNATDFAHRWPRAAEAIIKGHYVDDYLDSFNSIEEAKRVTMEVTSIHQKGGFEIRNWLSNVPDLVRSLGESPIAVVKGLDIDKSDIKERVLGMLWMTGEDVLGFSTQMREDISLIIQENVRPTKRQVLRYTMSLFDPLGLLALFSVHGKILIQQIWRSGIDWDDKIEDEQYELWQKWTSLLPILADIRIPRWYMHNDVTASALSTQLHIFVDASEEASSCVAYLRFVLSEDVNSCAIVAAKTKVAPLKPLSIPRLELQAAVLGSRLSQFIEENHSISIDKKVFWSDSSTVLAWIRSDSRRYTQFVSCRIGEILTITEIDEWRWVPTKLNIADRATKWGKGPDHCSRQWFAGPEFLYLPEHQWPEQPNVRGFHTEEEHKSCHVHLIEHTEPVIQLNHFSQWKRLLRTVAYMNRFVLNTRTTRNSRLTGCLTHDEIISAENIIWRICQRQSYPVEYAMLTASNGKTTLNKTSRLYGQCPFLDKNGVLRRYGRIPNDMKIDMDLKFPILLPKYHTVTQLLLNDYHRKYHHANNETVVNEIRQKFYIPHLRTMVRKIARECQMCKIRKCQPLNPIMAPLPAARLTAFIRPFSYIGLDFFGPMLVKIGRSNVKRWVALFTCLTIRAVHLEVAHTLSTESCISCFRRFVARRGAPLEVYSDNGTNFIGAERILQKQINSGLAETFTNGNTKWIFNPPAAPHMGGVWERMVRSIKSAMIGIESSRRLNDEAFLTLLAEAEGIVNCRPLTYIPLETPEQEALTPNHFLLGSSSGIKQPVAQPTDSRNALRSSWNQIRHQADLFWNRWLREYLPTICRRTKWFEETRPIEVGELVYIVDGAKRNCWIRGRVIETRRGKDGIVRKALVQTSSGILIRPACKLAILDVLQNGKTVSDTQCYGRGDVSTDEPPAHWPFTNDRIGDDVSRCQLGRMADDNKKNQ